MGLSATAADEYFRLAQQSQVLYAYWLSAGDVERARLAMDVANWYYQQLGIPFYLPPSLPGYVPNPTSPNQAALLGPTLPAVGSAPAGSAGSGTGSGFGSRFTTPGSYCSIFPEDPVCIGEPGYFPPNADYCAAYPDDPICGGTYGGGSAGLPPVVIENPVNITVNQDGLTLGDVASRISGALASATAAIAGAVDAVLAGAIKGIQHALTAIGNELMSVYQLLSRLAGQILQFLKGLLLDLIHGVVTALQAVGRALKDVIQNGLMPALRALQKVRDYLVQIYERYLRKLLVILQDLRKVLAILKVFHIGFAAKLDAALSDIQRKISAPLLYLLQFTNTIANYINLILDARLYIQRPLFLASLNANKGGATNILLNGMNPVPDPAAVQQLQAAGVQPTPAQSTAAVVQLLGDGTGDLHATVTDQASQLDAYLQQGFV